MESRQIVARHFESSPFGNKILNRFIGILWLIYLVGHFPRIFSTPHEHTLGMWLIEAGGMQGIAVFHLHQWWRLVTPALLHLNFTHILFNTLALWSFARQDQQYERSKYGWMWIFGVTAVVGNLLIGWMTPAEVGIGASGGIMGLWGAHMMITLRSYLSKNRELAHVRHTQKLWQEIFWVFLQMGLLDHIIHGIAWQAHLGGFLAGMAMGLFLQLRGQRYVFATRQGLVTAEHSPELVTSKIDKMRKGSAVTLDLSERFKPHKDCVLIAVSAVDWRNRVRWHRSVQLAGHMHGKKFVRGNMVEILRLPTVTELEYDKSHPKEAAQFAN